MDEIKEHDVVALLEDVPEHRLSRGEVGTVVHLFKAGAYEVDSATDRDGLTPSQL